MIKQTMTKLTVLALAVSLTACSTNTQNENTAVGAGTGAVAGGLLGTIASGAGRGWVIAAGAVVGALLGGYIGHSMDSSDNEKMSTAMNNNSINEPSNWTNDKTGVWYKIVPTSGFITYKGNPNCRHYIAYGKDQNGKTTKNRGIACRMDNNMWQQVK
jgi:surface antigen